MPSFVDVSFEKH